MGKKPSLNYVVFVITSFASLEEVMVEAPDVLAEHMARSKAMHAAGTLPMAGAFLDNEDGQLSTMAIVPTREVAEEFVRGDPFVVRGLVKSWRIRAWADMFA